MGEGWTVRAHVVRLQAAADALVLATAAQGKPEAAVAAFASHLTRVLAALTPADKGDELAGALARELPREVRELREATLRSLAGRGRA